MIILTVNISGVVIVVMIHRVISHNVVTVFTIVNIVVIIVVSVGLFVDGIAGSVGARGGAAKVSWRDCSRSGRDRRRHDSGV